MRTFIAIFLLGLAACSAPTPPLGPQTHVRVSPRTSTITVGQGVALTAATIDSTGDSVGVATVTWNSSAPSVASVTSGGVVSGVAPGVATVVASTERGQRDSAVITVIAAICGGVGQAAQLHGTATFTYQYQATLNDVTYAANDQATMTFTVDATGPDGHGGQFWMGASTGNGSEQESRTDNQTGEVQTLSGSGALIVQDINLSHAIVDVDLNTCRYTLEGVPYIDVTETPSPGDLGPSWIGWFRTAWTPLDTATHAQPLATHSAVWLGPNYNAGATSWYVPLGFSTDYFSNGAPDDGSAGTVSVTYSIARGP
jgi:Bacterial Ig-like domain (group 2)